MIRRAVVDDCSQSVGLRELGLSRASRNSSTASVSWSPSSSKPSELQPGVGVDRVKPNGPAERGLRFNVVETEFGVTEVTPADR